MAQNVAYTAEEKEMLVHLIRKYPIIEEKKTDATSIKRKSEAWEKLCLDYNAIASNTKRTVIQLKRCWDKVKRFRKEELAAERRNLMATGGGPPVPENKTLSIVDMAVPHLGYEVPNSFDSDGAFLNAKITATVSEADNVVEVIEKSPYLTEGSSTCANEYQPTYTTLENISSVSVLPVSQLNASKIKKMSREVGVKSQKQKSVDMLMSVRLKNAEAENLQAVELHNIRIKIEEENLRTAKLKSRAAELKLQIVEMELETAKLKYDKEINK